MITVKFSYSILNSWENYSQEDAVAMYLGKPLPDSAPMRLGNAKHDLWEQQVKETQRVPDDLIHPEDAERGLGILQDPLTEQKYEKIIPMGENHQILLRGRVDCIDGKTLYDWKCGSRSATEYLNALQLDYYKFLLPHLEKGMYRCFNPYTNERSIGVKYLTDENAEKALNHILTYGGEMIQYLEATNQIKNYNPNWRDDPATSGQLNYLKKFPEVEVPDNPTKGWASDVLNKVTK